MTDLRDRLQGALGSGYRVEKELGGGGMSRVFLAEETRLGRRVVVKVLPPEMAAGVSVERFEREIQLAAKLQHPHIVPLLSAGSSDDLLYYIMPYIEGESLRAKLAREGELPVAEALRILREVLDALAHAHGHHVVHRDIKPDNVLLSGKHALVTDFGVAKAVAASTGQAGLTSIGVALGTPLYMAPEQASADPHTDHRADVYAVGAMAYEMLCGRPPFTGTTAQAVLAAHLTDPPEPVTRHRTAVPESLNHLILRCLEKKPADRWQQVDELLPHIESLLTSASGVTPTGTQPVISSGTRAAIARAHPARVATLFVLASIGVLAIVYGLVQVMGLPDWAFYGAIGLLAVGLPIMVFTGHHERRRALERTSGSAVPTPTGLKRFLTWRRALLGGGLAFAALGVVTIVYTAMRVLGIGPAGTLMATGVIGARDPLVVADFENRTADSSLGPSVTEAFQIDLAQSPTVKLLDGAAVVAVLQRMGRDPSSPMDARVAREIAERGGAKAFVVGEVAPLGAGFVLSARVLSTASGDVLLALRETAADQTQIIGAVDRLSGRLRERLGESLKTIRATEPLEQVTTASLEALRRYTQGVRTFQQSDYVRAIPLLEAAIAADSTFAMAYRRLAVALFNTGSGRSREMAAASKAFQFRHRLPPKERYLAEAFYYTSVEPNRESVMAAYQAALEVDPDDRTALNNLALAYNQGRRYQEAESLALRAAALADATSHYVQVIYAQVGQGKFAAAESTLARLGRRIPNAPTVPLTRALFALAQGRLDDGVMYYDSLRRLDRGPIFRSVAHHGLADVALLGGRLGEAERQRRSAMAVDEARRLPAAFLAGALDLARVELDVRNNPPAALRAIQAALALHPLPTLSAYERPHVELAVFYADAGEVDLALRTMAEYQRDVAEPRRREDAGQHRATGSIALAEGRLQESVSAFRLYREESGGPWTGLLALAKVYDRRGNPDSALAYYERLVTTPALSAGPVLATRPIGASRFMALAPAMRRLAELYEQRGEREKTIEYYSKFVELWKDADPELQPVVREVRGRLARLAGER